MSTNQPAIGWTLDPTRNKYYYFNVAEQAYVYQDGERIQLNANPGTTAQTTSTGNNGADDTRAGVSRAAVLKAIKGAGQTTDDEGDSSDDSDEEDSDGNGDDDNDGDDGADGGMNALSRRVARSGLADEGTTPEIQNIGKYTALTRGILKGNSVKHNASKLYPEYKVRRHATEFFGRGKVFKALWPEMLGQSNESVTTTPDSRFGEDIATKIRWFIVVRAGNGQCTCVPIVTYNRQGVAKKGINKKHHAIAYTTRKEPAPQENEKPRTADEKPMLPGIRVVPKKKQFKLDPMSRIDFSRIYTVEHNVKVFDFGNVHEDHMQRLIAQWIRVFQEGPLEEFIHLKNTHQQSDSSDEDDDDDDDESDDAEDTHKRPTHPPTGRNQGSGGYDTTAGYTGTPYPTSTGTASTQSQYQPGTYGSGYDPSQPYQQDQYSAGAYQQGQGYLSQNYTHDQPNTSRDSKERSGRSRENKESSKKSSGKTSGRKRR